MKIRAWFNHSILSCEFLTQDAQYKYFWRAEFAQYLNKDDEPPHAFYGSPIEIRLQDVEGHYAWITVSDAVWAAICAKLLESE